MIDCEVSMVALVCHKIIMEKFLDPVKTYFFFFFDRNRFFGYYGYLKLP